MSSRPHKLELYRWSVQHPQAEVSFLKRVHAHYAGAKGAATPTATLLKEDFAGTAAVAAAWVLADEDHRAVAVERDYKTVRWALRRLPGELGERSGDLHLLCGDVMELDGRYVPKVDVIAALNFSAFVYHERETLRAYFRAARRLLRPGGVLVMDAYGGPGAMTPGTQRRRVEGPGVEARAGGAVEYVWEQRGYDAVTSKVDCRIHFGLAGGGVMRNAFRYDWRLWTLTELRELMVEAGFARAEAWCDRYAAEKGTSDGVYRPVSALPARHDWVAYVVGARG